jgi:hypothetical protein
VTVSIMRIKPVSEKKVTEKIQWSHVGERVTASLVVVRHRHGFRPEHQGRNVRDIRFSMHWFANCLFEGW